MEREIRDQRGRRPGATVNNPDIARRLLAMGAQGVMTDRIDLLRQHQAA